MKIAMLIMLMIEMGLNPDTNNIYPMTAQIVGFDYESNLVTVKEAGSDECFQFYGIEDWLLGDVISFMMADNATPGEWNDDVILDHWFTGVNLPMTIDQYMIPEDPPIILTCGE